MRTEDDIKQAHLRILSRKLEQETDNEMRNILTNRIKEIEETL